MTYRLFVMRPKNIWTLFSKCQVISSCGVAASAGVVGYSGSLLELLSDEAAKSDEEGSSSVGE